MLRNKEIPMKNIYQKLFIIFLVAFFIGNIFRYEPPALAWILLSFLVVFFSKRKVKAMYIYQYLFIFVLAIYGVWTALFNNGGFGAPLTIITGLMVCYAAQQLKFNKTEISVIFLSLCISAIYWLYRSPTYYEHFLYNYHMGDASFINPNGIGHYLAYEASFIFIILSIFANISLICDTQEKPLTSYKLLFHHIRE